MHQRHTSVYSPNLNKYQRFPFMRERQGNKEKEKERESIDRITSGFRRKTGGRTPSYFIISSSSSAFLALLVLLGLVWSAAWHLRLNTEVDY